MEITITSKPIILLIQLTLPICHIIITIIMLILILKVLLIKITLNNSNSNNLLVIICTMDLDKCLNKKNLKYDQIPNVLINFLLCAIFIIKKHLYYLFILCIIYVYLEYSYKYYIKFSFRFLVNPLNLEKSFSILLINFIY